jgi:hypothetical protein
MHAGLQHAGDFPRLLESEVFLIQHDNVDGTVANPLVVSRGVKPYTAMHGDYFAANQSVFNNELLDLCLRNAPDSVTIADPRCGLGPLEERCKRRRGHTTVDS